MTRKEEVEFDEAASTSVPEVAGGNDEDGGDFQEEGIDNLENESDRNIFVSFFVSILSLLGGHILKVLRDSLTFITRGGLGTLTFCIDQFLSLFCTIGELIPGFFIISYGLRSVAWIFTMMLWVLYTAIELILYLPPKLLLFYVIMLCVAYSMVPDAANTVLEWMYWFTHGFLHLLKRYVFN